VVKYVVLARVLISWFIRDPSNPVYRFLSTLTDPLMNPLSRVLTFGGIDLSPIVVFMGIQFLQRYIASLAY
jgi:YggT family protein